MCVFEKGVSISVCVFREEAMVCEYVSQPVSHTAFMRLSGQKAEGDEGGQDPICQT